MCLLGVLALGEQARGLEHVVDAQVLPGERGRVALGAGLGGLAVDGEARVRRGHFPPEAAVGRVVLQQVGEVRGRNQVVHGDELEASLDARAVGEAPDATETVDANLDGHVWCLLGPRGGTIARRPTGGHGLFVDALR
jgi:hypothetical protein